MDGNSHTLSIGASTLNMSNNNNNTNLNNDLGMVFSIIPPVDETEADVLNDETFGDCDLDQLKIKSDFNEDGEFLGDNTVGGAGGGDELPDFFNTDISDTGGDGGLSLIDNNNNDDQSQQQSIDALLGEDPMRLATTSLHFRQSTNNNNPLFSMAISQAADTNQRNIFSQPQQHQHQLPPRPIPAPQPQINYQLLKQFEQLLIQQQIPAQQRIQYLQAMIANMQREQQTPRFPNQNHNGHNPNNSLLHEATRSMAMNEMMDRARLTSLNNSRSQSPGISTQFMAAIQRSDQIPINDNHQKQNSSPPTIDTVGSPSSPHHHNHSRHNRPARHYPRPPLLNTWQGRGPGYDEFAGMMSDREKQWVVKIQLHQVSQSQDEDYYFQKWSHKKRGQDNQSNRQYHRTQKISYPVLQLLKSIQQENELAQRLSQTSNQVQFSNVNPSQGLPYATPLQTQLGKQSTATPRHPRCTLHLDGQFSLGTRANAITHDKYQLGLLLHMENLYRDLLPLDKTEEFESLLSNIIDRYLNNSTYFFADLFAQSSKGQFILERLYPYLTKSTNGQLELILIHLYSSLTYMISRWPKTFHIQSNVMNIISLMLQQVNVKKTTYEQLLAQIYSYYNEQIKSKLTELDPALSSSPFSNPLLFTNSSIVTLLIELVIVLERQCYLLSGANQSTLPIHIMQQLQHQLQYQFTEHVRLFVNDLCQGFIACPSVGKILKPFTQVQQQQFSLLCKFIRIQLNQQIYAILEPKLIECCVKNS